MARTRASAATKDKTGGKVVPKTGGKSKLKAGGRGEPTSQMLQPHDKFPKMVVLPKVPRSRTTKKNPMDGPRPFHSSDLAKYGMQASATATSKSGQHQVVVAAKCLFCIAFGREAKLLPAPSSVDAIVAKPRALVSTKKVFSAFRTDMYTNHLTHNHPAKWIEYQGIRNDLGKARAFFEQHTISAFLPTRKGYSFTVSAAVVKVIETILCNSKGRGEDWWNQFQIIEEELPGDMGPITDDPAAACNTRGASFRELSGILSDVTEVMGCNAVGRPSERDIGQCVRKVVGINLSRIESLLKSCWCFSMGADGATHRSEGYLDVRLCFPIDGDIANVHALAIPMGNQSHTGANYASAVLGFLNLLCPGAVHKLIGITTDGAANMMGKVKGFNTLISKAVTDGKDVHAPYVVWCFLHQTNLQVGKMLSVLDESHNFRSLLSSVLAFVRAHSTLTSEINYPATYAETRWASIYQSCKWISQRRSRIIAFAASVGKEASMPPKAWWICLVAAESITKRISEFFEKMQYQTISPREQLAGMRALCAELRLISQSQAVAGGPISYCHQKLETLAVGEDMDAWYAYQESSEEVKRALLKAIEAAIESFTAGVDAIYVKSAGVPMLPQTPYQLARGGTGDFMDGLQRHRAPLASFGGDGMVNAIACERTRLVQQYARGGKLTSAIDAHMDGTFAAAWGGMVDSFPLLSIYCTGLATVLPATHTVESDFSILKNTKDDTRRSLSNYAMEGQMQAKQFTAMIAAVTSAKRAQARVTTSAVL